MNQKGKSGGGKAESGGDGDESRTGVNEFCGQMNQAEVVGI